MTRRDSAGRTRTFGRRAIAAGGRIVAANTCAFWHLRCLPWAVLKIIVNHACILPDEIRSSLLGLVRSELERTGALAMWQSPPP